jgi:hypothetical protein
VQHAEEVERQAAENNRRASGWVAKVVEEAVVKPGDAIDSHPHVARAVRSVRIARLMELIVFSGIQASGKTTFYRERFLATHVRVSLDLLKTRQREDILLFACFAAQQPVVVDNNQRFRRAADALREARQGGGISRDPVLF